MSKFQSAVPPDSPFDHLDLKAFESRNMKRKAVKDEATPGPWYVKTNTYRGYGIKYEVRRQMGTQNPNPDETVVPEGLDRKNKEFIAFTRNDTPEQDIDLLLDTLYRMRKLELTMYSKIGTLEVDHRERFEALQREHQVQLDAAEARRQQETGDLERRRLRETEALQQQRQHETDALKRMRQQEQATYTEERNRLLETIRSLEQSNHNLNAQLTQLNQDYRECREAYDQYIRDTENLYLSAGIIRRALEFYADEQNWEWEFVSNPVLKDQGNTARGALEASQYGKDMLHKIKQLESAAASPDFLLQQVICPQNGTPLPHKSEAL